MREMTEAQLEAMRALVQKQAERESASIEEMRSQKRTSQRSRPSKEYNDREERARAATYGQGGRITSDGGSAHSSGSQSGRRDTHSPEDILTGNMHHDRKALK